MNNWFRLLADVSNYQAIGPVDPSVYRTLIDETQGRPVHKPWRVVSLQRIPDEPHLPLGDNPKLLARVSLVSERARAVLEPIVQDEVEWLETKFGRQTLWIMNVVRIVDAIDYDHSRVDRMPSWRIGFITNLMLRGDQLRNTRICKLLECEDTEPLVSPDVRYAIEKAGLEGFRFDPVPLNNPHERPQ